MRVLRDFIHGLDFVRMRPGDTVIADVSAGVTPRVLVLPLKTIAVFLKGGGSATTLSVRIPAGTWTVEWVDTRTGLITRRPNVSGGTVQTLAAPAYETDIALRLLQQ